MSVAMPEGGWQITMKITEVMSRATAAFEEDRRQRLAAGVRRHKAATSAVLTTDQECLKCGRLCVSSFGLTSHMRSHPPRDPYVAPRDTLRLPGYFSARRGPEKNLILT
ncbi:hypothetical protein Bbelb_157140 [Branchiostoma belcheri]|nr:hypothetical protein Bbelb_157140 [Branchiostoma belcheri]